MSTTQTHYPAPADVVVHIDDAGEIRALWGHDGSTITHARDASAVIQAAIDSLPATGGRIYIAAGAYHLNSTITIEDKHGVHLEGAARGIVFSGGNEGTVLRSEKDIDLLCIFGRRVKVAGVTVSNLHLVGSGKANGHAGLLVRGDSDLLSLHHVGANHCGIGFHLEGGHGEMLGVIDACQIQCCDPQVNGIGLKIERCHYGKIIGGEFSDCDEYGILIASPDSGPSRTQGVKIIGGSAVRNGLAAILVGPSTDDITLTGGSDFAGSPAGSGIVVSDQGTGRRPRNVIVSNAQAYNNRDAGILVENADHVIVQACIASAHEHAWVENRGQRYGIHVRGTAENVLAVGNITYGNAQQGMLDETNRAHLANNV